jgi:hypothetical protein
MGTITFKAKVKDAVYMGEDKVDHQYIDIPNLKKHHCNMNEFHSHKRWGGFSNSDLFESILQRIKNEVFGGDKLRLDAIPEGVSVDTSKFLAVVTFRAN